MNIGRWSDVLVATGGLLRRHIGRGSQDDTDLSLPRRGIGILIQQLRQSKIGDFGTYIRNLMTILGFRISNFEFTEKDIGGLEVSVNDAAVVSIIHCSREWLHESDRVFT